MQTGCGAQKRLRDGHEALGTSQALSQAAWLTPLSQCFCFSQCPLHSPSSCLPVHPEEANLKGAAWQLHWKSPPDRSLWVCQPGASPWFHQGLPAWRTATLTFLERGPQEWPFKRGRVTGTVDTHTDKASSLLKTVGCYWA